MFKRIILVLLFVAPLVGFIEKEEKWEPVYAWKEGVPVWRFGF